MAAEYDVTLDTINFVSLNDQFSEQIGSDYELVGAAAMPGAPTPLGIYSVDIPIHGDAGEFDPYTAGDSIRSQTRSLFQNDTLRFQGVAFSTTFDTQINGWLVLGAGTISYAPGGPTIADYGLSFNAAHVGAQQTLLQAHRLDITDRREAVTVDPLRRLAVTKKLKGAATQRHYLPVGAWDIVGQLDPVIPDLHEYTTIFGKGYYVEDRGHGEMLTFELEPDMLHKADVRVYDTQGKSEPEWSKAGDLNPQPFYRWVRALGPTYPFSRGMVPAIDNGRCRFRHEEGGTFVVDVAKAGVYERDVHRIVTGYPTVVQATMLSYTHESATVKVVLASQRGRAEMYVRLDQGWTGPQIDLYHQGAKSPLKLDGEGFEHAQDDWQHLRVNTSPAEALVDTSVTRRLIRRA